MGILSDFGPKLKYREGSDAKPAKPAKPALSHTAGPENKPPTLATLAALAVPLSLKKNVGPPVRGPSDKPDETVDRVIDATFRPTATDPVWPQMGREVIPLDPEFPPCPVCGSPRYWISKGKVMCGSRRCYSAVRFILTSIAYHQVH